MRVADATGPLRCSARIRYIKHLITPSCGNFSTRVYEYFWTKSRRAEKSATSIYPHWVYLDSRFWTWIHKGPEESQARVRCHRSALNSTPMMRSNTRQGFKTAYADISALPRLSVITDRVWASPKISAGNLWHVGVQVCKCSRLSSL